MLQTIHDKLKGIFAITILLALGIVFVFWGVNVSVGDFTRARGIEVNGQEVAVEDVRQSYQDELTQYQTAFGAAGVPEEMRTALQSRVLEQTLRRELIRQRTRELDYAASDTEVLAAIRAYPAFQVGGEFSEDAYRTALTSVGQTPAQFEAAQRGYALAQQLDRGLFASAFVLPSEFERAVALRNETREIAWITVPAADFAGSVALDEAAIVAYYESHKSQYMTEEQATVDFIELDIEDFAAATAIGEEDVREFYESNKQRYTTVGRRQARHILIAAGEDDAAAEARAKAAADRARAGEDFGKLALELSDDTGSKESGGDLGFAERGDFVAAFGDAVWGMTPGEVRGPVKSEFGWHVIQLVAVEPEVTQSFDEVRTELEPELRRMRVEQAFGEAQETLDTIAFEAAGNLVAVADELKLPVRRVERFTRAGGGELGATPALTDAVFAPEVLAGRELRVVEMAPGKVVAIGVSAHSPAAPRPLDEVRPAIVAAARLVRAQALAAEKAAAVATELGSGAAWDAATRAWQKAPPATTHLPRLVRRDDLEMPDELKTAAFKVPSPEGRPRYGTSMLGTGDTAVWTVTSVRAGTLAALSDAERQQQYNDARERAAMSDATAYVSAMRANADIDVNPKLFE